MDKNEKPHQQDTAQLSLLHHHLKTRSI